MDTSKTVEATITQTLERASYSLWQLICYFLRLGTLGFSGPVALVGYMQRDLVENRAWIAETDYNEGLVRASFQKVWQASGYRSLRQRRDHGGGHRPGTAHHYGLSHDCAGTGYPGLAVAMEEDPGAVYRLRSRRYRPGRVLHAPSLGGMLHGTTSGNAVGAARL
jgi:hypothetical protein